MDLKKKIKKNALKMGQYMWIFQKFVKMTGIQMNIFFKNFKKVLNGRITFCELY